MSHRWSVNEPWVGDGRAMGERRLVINSKLCPDSVRVQGLSRGCPSLSHHLSMKQTILSPSKDCPSSIFVQNLSDAEKCRFGILLLDTVALTENEWALGWEWISNCWAVKEPQVVREWTFGGRWASDGRAMGEHQLVINSKLCPE